LPIFAAVNYQKYCCYCYIALTVGWVLCCVPHVGPGVVKYVQHVSGPDMIQGDQIRL